jgi:hypothetical protein
MEPFELMGKPAGMPRACPKCGSDRVRVIVYGLAADLGMEDVVLGGCCICPGLAEWSCGACGHAWGDIWNAERPEGDKSPGSTHPGGEAGPGGRSGDEA